MKGLVITTEDKMQVREFGEPAYETIGKAVGGWIEVVHPKLSLIHISEPTRH